MNNQFDFTSPTYGTFNKTDSSPFNFSQSASGGGFNFMDGAQLGLGALQTIGGLYNAYQRDQLAKKAFNQQLRAFNTSLADNRQVYNTALEDRISSRYAAEGRSPEEAQAYIAANKLG